MKIRRNANKVLLLIIPTFLVMISVACGAEAPVETVPEGPVTVKVIVTDVQVSDGGERVESMTVRTEDGMELSMRLSDDIDPTLWGPSHLLGHIQAGELGIQIGVTYMRTPDGTIATELSE